MWNQLDPVAKLGQLSTCRPWCEHNIGLKVHRTMKRLLCLMWLDFRDGHFFVMTLPENIFHTRVACLILFLRTEHVALEPYGFRKFFLCYFISEIWTFFFARNDIDNKFDLEHDLEMWNLCQIWIHSTNKVEKVTLYDNLRLQEAEIWPLVFSVTAILDFMDTDH